MIAPNIKRDLPIEESEHIIPWYLIFSANTALFNAFMILKLAYIEG